MKKSDLRDKAGISSASIAKLGKGDNITTDVLIKICEEMNCHLKDIMESIDEREKIMINSWIIRNYE